MHLHDFLDEALEAGLALERRSPYYWSGLGLSLPALRQMVAEASIATGTTPFILLSPSMAWDLRFELADAATEDFTRRGDDLERRISELGQAVNPIGSLADVVLRREVAGILKLMHLQLRALAVSAQKIAVGEREFYGAKILEYRSMPKNRLVVAADGDLDPPAGHAWHQGRLVRSEPSHTSVQHIWMSEPDGVRPEGMGGRAIYSFTDKSKPPV